MSAFGGLGFTDKLPPGGMEVLTAAAARAGAETARVVEETLPGGSIQGYSVGKETVKLIKLFKLSMN